MTSTEVVLLVAFAAASWWMAAVAWMVQLLVYPGFARVAPERWHVHHELHSSRTTWLVAAPMLVQLAACCLWLLDPVAPVGRGWAGALLALVGVTWLVTALVSVPCHTRLSHRWSAADHARLVRTTWVRTVAWSVLAGCSALLVARALVAAG